VSSAKYTPRRRRISTPTSAESAATTTTAKASGSAICPANQCFCEIAAA
jgi:hypothetical protein